MARRRERWRGQRSGPQRRSALDGLDVDLLAFLEADTDDAARRFLDEHPDRRTLIDVALGYHVLLEADRRGDGEATAKAARRVMILAGATDSAVLVHAVRLEHLAVSFGLGSATDEDVGHALDLISETDSWALASALDPALSSQVYNSFSIIKGACAQIAGRADLVSSGLGDIERAVELTSPADEALAGRLNNLANYLGLLYDQTGDRDLFVRSLETSRRCVRVTREGHASLASHLTGLAARLQQWYELDGDRDHLLEAHDLARRAVEMTPQGDPYSADRMVLLAQLRAAL